MPTFEEKMRENYLIIPAPGVRIWINRASVKRAIQWGEGDYDFVIGDRGNSLLPSDFDGETIQVPPAIFPIRLLRGLIALVKRIWKKTQGRVAALKNARRGAR